MTAQANGDFQVHYKPAGVLPVVLLYAQWQRARQGQRAVWLSLSWQAGPFPDLLFGWRADPHPWKVQGLNILTWEEYCVRIKTRRQAGQDHFCKKDCVTQPKLQVVRTAVTCTLITAERAAVHANCMLCHSSGVSTAVAGSV